MLDTATDVEIQGSGEYFTGEALCMKLTEQMTKLQAQYIEILSKASEDRLHALIVLKNVKGNTNH